MLKMRYYDKRDKKIYNTSRMTSEALAKKDFLLPVEINKINIQDTETTTEVNGIVELEDKVVWTTITKFHVDTLEEAKEKKITALKNYVAPKFPKDYKQRNASLGVYSEEDSLKIINEVKKWDEYIDNSKILIYDCVSIKDLEALDYRTQEDIEKAKLMEEEMDL